MDCGEGGFWKIYFIALFYLYVNSGRRGILRPLWCGLCAFVEAACATGGILSARTEQTSVSIVKF